MVHEGTVEGIIKEQKDILEVKNIFIILILVIVYGCLNMARHQRLALLSWDMGAAVDLCH